ncbi:ATPase, T2SS/T4P/T4SS family [Lachnospiraceae bacterium 38-14]|uniref:ATPase, T2SS/T4P/T4SS family n=1 Tax=Roseburia sp. 1XD42-69 TaxID=2320088 RepID=UPI001FAA662D|nr:ATPase, T2SS/T4P/T4SS family [Roseburia sp. 1XD42-69]MCX4320610.1 ATPase, T2SS/T4P/T4SS family [Lachnospiraceae bacterium]
MISTEINMNPEAFGPLYPYIANPQITDIDFNGEDLWIVTTENRRCKIDAAKEKITPSFLEQFAGRIANEVSRGFNQMENVLEAETGHLRITIVHESVALTGRSFCIRKSLPRVRFTPAKALEQEYCSREMLEMLVNCVLAKMNFVFCGEPAAGKTECAKFFSQFIPANEKVITIEDNPEWHYRQINPGKDCVELKINPRLDYSKAIKTCLRLNPNWMMLSEVRSREAKALIECWSTGIKGFTTIHTDDVRKIPDRLLNMMENRLDAGRLVNDIYSYVDVGVLLRRKESVRDGKIRRYIDQICFFYQKEGDNRIALAAKGGRMQGASLPQEVLERFARAKISDPFFCGKIRQMLKEGEEKWENG